MSSYRKNLLVGVVVLGGLLVLAWMVLQFGDAPVKLFKTEQIAVEFVADRAVGLNEGSPVSFRGVTVGRISGIARSADHQSVRIRGLIDADPPLPGNLVARIRASGFVGGSSGVTIQVPAGEQPSGTLQADQVIETAYVGLDLLPSEYTELADELKLTARQFRESGVVDDLAETVRSAGEMIERLNRIVGEPQIREDLTTALANIRQATDTATRIATNLESFSANLDEIGDQTQATLKQAQGTVQKVDHLVDKTGGHIDKLAGQVDERLVQVAKLLNTFQSLSRKIDQGKGTAGALINDERLYESLVLTSQQLNSLVTDLNRLVEQWEQEGATLRIRP